MESNTKTIAKRARMEPHTQMHVTMEFFLSCHCSRVRCLINFEICFRSCIEAFDGLNEIEN